MARAECPDFPQSQWWKTLSHDAVNKYVQAKHGGDWTKYIDKWERQYQTVKNIYDKGSAIVIGKDRIKVAGENLRIYVDKIKLRVEVIHCLSKEVNSAPSETGSTQMVSISGDGSIDPVAGKEKARAAGCFECHGEYGRGGDNPAAPHLAGQNDIYIVKQLKELQKLPSGGTNTYGTIERHNKVMREKVISLNDSDIWNLASFFSKQPCRSSTEANYALDMPEAAKSCMKCHGNNGVSVFPEVPNIAGQKESYLTAQIKAFRKAARETGDTGDKDIRYHYIMSMKVKDLNIREIRNVSKYYASLRCE
ncbi:MAG: c-type cytochrome [Rhodospirillales bacterium]|nr:c-type cytochrome [Rhodospirillales bacterium]